MKRIVLLFALLLTSPALAQSKPTAASRADPCAPIGRTADGRLVYGMKCENLPASVPLPNSVATPAPVAPVEEEDKGGLFRNPFPSLIKPTNVERTPGVGPAGAR